ncbi:Ubiquitin carboxyl-terminal hydrolase-related protein [Perilla frutescens var. hirtella]|uniref:Ubiquitin carboxyl-terminal hydrolase-related protein n=1 Tax=Perilla frutescens var. hirtella TaxID=608512 RepID=A0AAD4PFK8_PERFH|nr:Ubiquitin carboxyl-terminal hydrolase-related protein [Perilla frutescens var. hirtella]
MGHKKRTVAPRSKPSHPPSAAAVADDAADGGASNLDNSPNPSVKKLAKSESADLEGNSNVNSNGNPSAPYASIKLECERALTALRRGNHTKALRLMKDLCSRNENYAHSALIHRVQGTVCVKVASIIDDPNAKQRHLKNAIESARRAVSLSPNSIEFAHFYANLLYEAATEGKEYEDVVQECERALSIENPVDPAKESLQEENQQKMSTTEARVGHVQSELRSLIQKSNIASISTWMKNLGNGEEKFRLIPIRRIPEDPMEVRMIQPRRPNEIKKVAKTPEERRKEIEVRVAAARLLQQKSESPSLGNDGDGSNTNSKVVDSCPGSGQRAGERRKIGNSRKNASSDDRRDWVRSYWNSMSLDVKKDVLRIEISDLKAHFRSMKDGLPSEVLNEALSFGETNKMWKFWSCCRCHEKFADVGLFMQHVVEEHMSSLLPKMQSILPQSVDNEWAEMLLNCSWKPLELNTAIRMHRKQSTLEAPDFFEESYSRHSIDDSKECFVDTYCNEYEWDSSPRNKRFGDNFNDGAQDSRDFEDVEWMDCDGDQSSKESLLNENWPLSDDPERAKLLEKIQVLFQSLIRNKYLASSHLSKVIHFAVEELQSLACSSQLLSSNLEQTPLCICFLGAPELKKILNFLQEISHSCGLSRYSDKSNAADNSNTVIHGVDIMEKITFSQDASYLILDEHFLPCMVPRQSCDDTVNCSSVETSSHVNYENGIILDSDAMLSWIFKGPSSGEQLTSWMRAKEEKAQQGLEILQLLEKESYHLQGLCERKFEHLNYEEALQSVEDLCLEEGKRREHVTDFVRRSYDTVLRKRREELIDTENENDMAIMNNRFELDAITNVLKEAESLNVNQFGFEETYSGVRSHLCDLESGEDDDWRTKDYLHQVDSCIEVAIQRQKEHVSIEISKIDARVMRILVGMQKLEIELDPASSHDYRSILVPLLKSFLRARLEDLAEKDAREKSDAAREAFLAELALDSKKGVTGGGDNSKHERSKDKKKSKEGRKNKDSKAIHWDEPHDQIFEEILLPSGDDEEVACSELADNGIDDALRLQEEEYKRKIELEAEERKLEETLEYQRRIENEAKQKHLAEQHKKNSRNSGEKAEPISISDAYLRCNNEEKDVSDQWMKKKEPLMQGGFTEILESLPTDSANGAVMRNGLPNGAIPQEGVLSSERRSGKRGKRHKGLNKPSDRKSPPLTSEKEDNASVQPRHEQNSHGDVDNGGKTLRQLQAEEDDEERFQADLKKAVLQSLDAFNAHKKLPVKPNLVLPHKETPETSDLCVSCGEGVADVNGIDTYGTGLKNEVGEYNCFLNVIIQSLWHLRRFRDEFMRRSLSEHVHVGNPCVICALYEIFIALSMVSKDNRRESVTPTSLRVALSNLYPESNFFQEGQMNDASEVLGVIFNCLHRSFTHGPHESELGSVDSTGTGSWDCTNASCIAHSLFGMDIFERMNCYNCGLESRYLKYTSFFHNINASAVRTMKVMCPEYSFDELLNLVEMNHQLACDPEAGGCGKLNYIHHILSSPPHVFTTVLGWQNTCESVDDIMGTLAALSTEIDISVLYRGLDPQNKHCLASVVCYYGQHYHCFAYSRDHEQWIMYDDKTVKVIGGWDDVLTICEKGHLQPQVLLFEAAN